MRRPIDVNEPYFAESTEEDFVFGVAHHPDAVVMSTSIGYPVIILALYGALQMLWSVFT